MTKISSKENSRARYKLGCVFAIMRLNRSVSLGYRLITTDPSDGKSANEAFESVFNSSSSLSSHLQLLNIVEACLVDQCDHCQLWGVAEFLSARVSNEKGLEKIEKESIWKVLNLFLVKDIRMTDLVFRDRQWMSVAEDHSVEICRFLASAFDRVFDLQDDRIAALVIDYVDRIIDTILNHRFDGDDHSYYECIAHSLSILSASIDRNHESRADIEKKKMDHLCQVLRSRLSYFSGRPWNTRKPYVRALMELFRLGRKYERSDDGSYMSVFSGGSALWETIGIALSNGSEFGVIQSALRTILFVASHRSELGPVEIDNLARSICSNNFCTENRNDENESVSCLLKARKAIEFEYERQLQMKTDELSSALSEIHRVKSVELQLLERLEQVTQRDNAANVELRHIKEAYTDAEKRVEYESGARVASEQARQAAIDELDLIKTQNAGLNRKIRHLTGEIERLQSSNESLRQTAEQEKQCLLSRMQDLEGRLRKLEDDLKVCEAERDEFSSAVDELRTTDLVRTAASFFVLFNVSSVV
ncbi:hypothetical protein ACOME3_003832 [Neoechinorhynchus agilis]